MLLFFFLKKTSPILRCPHQKTLNLSPFKTKIKTKTNIISNWNPTARWPAPRASALDAARLDSELTSLLAEQAGRALAPILSAGVAARFQPEMMAALEALVFSRTIAVGVPTPGLALLGLRFVDNRSGGSWWRRRRRVGTRRRTEGNAHDDTNGTSSSSSSSSSPSLPPLSVGQRTSYGLATVALTYAWDRAARSGLLLSERLSSDSAEGGGSSSSRLQRTATLLLRRAETAASVAALVNSVLFLSQRSRYRSSLELLLGAGLEPSDPSAPRSLSFDYLNRQLVWHELSELMLAVLPLFDRRLLARWRTALSGMMIPGRVVLLPSSSSASSSDVASEAAATAGEPAAGNTGGEAGDDDSSSSSGSGSSASSSATSCAACGASPPSTPFAALPCRHAHCYYCLAASCGADPAYECSRCGERVAAMVRLR